MNSILQFIDQVETILLHVANLVVLGWWIFLHIFHEVKRGAPAA